MSRRRKRCSSRAGLIVPLLKGGQVVTRVSGDPDTPGAPFVIRIENVDGEIVFAHWHPEDEHIVVVKGTWYLGAGDRFSRSDLRELTVGTADRTLSP